jgi:hypothetical protein
MMVGLNSSILVFHIYLKNSFLQEMQTIHCLKLLKIQKFSFILMSFNLYSYRNTNKKLEFIDCSVVTTASKLTIKIYPLTR